MEHIFVIAILNARRFAGVQRGKVEVKRHPAPASQLDLFGNGTSVVAERITQSRQAVRLFAPPVAEPVAQPKPPQPEFDCYLHPLIRSRWYLVQRRWTCAVCYPQLKEN